MLLAAFVDHHCACGACRRAIGHRRQSKNILIELPSGFVPRAPKPWSVELSDVTQRTLGAALRGAQARHEALAGNLANATTPGYVRQDVDFQSALRSALDAGRSPSDMAFAPRPDAAAGPVRADGGTVDVDAESAKLAANALEHQALVAVKEARGAVIKAALGVG